MPQTVVCFGDSITCGQISANYVDMLEERMFRQGWLFANAGVNNDLTYNLLQRIEGVIMVKPQFVTILIGTNDVLSTLRPETAAYNMWRKHLPRWPTLKWAYANLTEIIWRLKADTNAQIAVCSIPMLGEDLESPPNWRVREYNRVVKAIAEREKIDYLPVYERQVEYLKAAGVEKGKPYRGSVSLTMEYLFRYLLVHESFEAYSRRKGFALLTDSVHLNRKGARLIADLVEEYLQKQSTEYKSTLRGYII